MGGEYLEEPKVLLTLSASPLILISSRESSLLQDRYLSVNHRCSFYLLIINFILDTFLVLQ